MAERDHAPDPDGMNRSRDDDERSASQDESMSADSPPREEATPRTPDQFTEPPGSRRRGPDGPALDVGA
jgi:hypothetical protein